MREFASVCVYVCVSRGSLHSRVGAEGAMFRKNVRDLWMRDFVERRSDCVAIETPILMRSEVRFVSHSHSVYVQVFVAAQLMSSYFAITGLGGCWACGKLLRPRN